MNHSTRTEWVPSALWWGQLIAMMLGWYLWPSAWMISYLIIIMMSIGQFWSILAMDRHDTVRRLIRQRDAMAAEYDTKILSLRDQIARDRDDWHAQYSGHAVSWDSGYPASPDAVPIEMHEHILCYRCMELHAADTQHMCTPASALGARRLQYPADPDAVTDTAIIHPIDG